MNRRDLLRSAGFAGLTALGIRGLFQHGERWYRRGSGLVVPEALLEVITSPDAKDVMVYGPLGAIPFRHVTDSRLGLGAMRFRSLTTHQLYNVTVAYSHTGGGSVGGFLYA